MTPEEEALPWYYQCDGELLRCKYPYNLKVGWPPEGTNSIAVIQRDAEIEGIRIHVRARGKEHTKVMLTIIGPPGTTKAWYSRVRAGTKAVHPKAQLPSVHRVWIVPVSGGRLGMNEDSQPTGDTDESSDASDEDEHDTRPTADHVCKLSKAAGVVPEQSDAGNKEEAAPFLVPEPLQPSSQQSQQENLAGAARAAGAEAAPAPVSTASSSGGVMHAGARAEAAPARTPRAQGSKEDMDLDAEDNEMQPPDKVPRGPAQRPVDQRVARLYEAVLDAFQARFGQCVVLLFDCMMANARHCVGNASLLNSKQCTSTTRNRHRCCIAGMLKRFSKQRRNARGSGTANELDTMIILTETKHVSSHK